MKPRLTHRYNCEIEVPVLKPKQVRNRFPDFVIVPPEHIELTQIDPEQRAVTALSLVDGVYQETVFRDRILSPLFPLFPLFALTAEQVLNPEE